MTWQLLMFFYTFYSTFCAENPVQCGFLFSCCLKTCSFLMRKIWTNILYKWHDDIALMGYKWNAGFMKSASDYFFKWFRKVLFIFSLFIWHLICLGGLWAFEAFSVCVCVCLPLFLILPIQIARPQIHLILSIYYL